MTYICMTSKTTTSFVSFRSVAFIWLIWATIGLVHGASRYTDIVRYSLNAIFTASDFALYIMSYSFWVLITLALLIFLKRMHYPFSSTKLAFCCVFGLIIWLPIYFAIDYGISTITAGGTIDDYWTRLSGVSGSVVFFYAIIYLLTFAACMGSVLMQNTTNIKQANLALERQQHETALLLAVQKMQMMQSQLSPHFLFNCLGAISGLARQGDKNTLVEAVAKVGNLLRFTINNATENWISLDEEIGFCEDYLSLQHLRYANRFNYTANIELSDLHFSCPPFTLQPLLENIFRHVVDTTSQTIDITLKIQVQQGKIAITVCNSLFESTQQVQKSGTGIENLQSRLAHLYSDNYQFVITSNEQQYCVCLTLPKEAINSDV